MKTDRAYVCDGHGCDRNCADTLSPEDWKKYSCHHTTDPNHAKNKVARQRKWDYKHGKMIEKE